MPEIIVHAEKIPFTRTWTKEEQELLENLKNQALHSAAQTSHPRGTIGRTRYSPQQGKRADKTNPRNKSNQSPLTPSASGVSADDPWAKLGARRRASHHEPYARIKWGDVKPEHFTDVRPADFAMAAGWSYIENESTRRAATEIIQKDRRFRRSIEDIEILCCAKLDECLVDFAFIGTAGTAPENNEGLRAFRSAVYPFLRELRETTPTVVREFWKAWKAKAEVCRLKKKSGMAPTAEEIEETRECGQKALAATRTFFIELFQILHPLRRALRELFSNSGKLRAYDWMRSLSSEARDCHDSEWCSAFKKLESSLRSFMEKFHKLCSIDQPGPSVLPEVDKQMDKLVKLLEIRRGLFSGQIARRGRRKQSTDGDSNWEVERTDKMIASVQKWNEQFLNDPGTRTTHVLPTFSPPDFGEIEWWRESRYGGMAGNHGSVSTTATESPRSSENASPTRTAPNPTEKKILSTVEGIRSAVDRIEKRQLENPLANRKPPKKKRDKWSQDEIDLAWEFFGSQFGFRDSNGKPCVPDARTVEGKWGEGGRDGIYPRFQQWLASGSDAAIKARTNRATRISSLAALKSLVEAIRDKSK